MGIATSYLNPRPNDSEGAKAITYQQHKLSSSDVSKNYEAIPMKHTPCSPPFAERSDIF
jgi:hypothetical protein